MVSLAILPAALDAQPITFSVIGDVPYDDSELPVLQEHMVDHNLYSPGEFLFHVGDIFSGGTPCEEYRYEQVADILETLTVPAIMLPGDNETKDCDNPTQAWTFWTNHFLRLESNFCSDIQFSHQPGREENIAFVSKGVLFIGIHLVGGSNPSDLLQADADWVEQQLQQQAPFVRAAVILAQAGPGSGRDLFFNQFVPDAVAFAKPMIYIHGDGHSWIDDRPFSATNVRRIQVERGDEPPIAVTVTTDAVPLFVIDRNPFDGPTVNRPPCVDAGPDLGIGISQQAWLRGQADDDGDPGSASLGLTWSKVSGPGNVTFTSPGTAETFASFSLVGTYVVRLRASDGLLASTDDVSVTVNLTAPSNDPPVIASDSYSTLMQRTLTVTAPGVLANDSDPNGTAISAVLVSGPTHGTFTLNANGGFTYTPQAGYFGLDGFSYRASDGTLQSGVASVTLNVTPFTLTLAPVDDATGNSSTPSKPAGSSSSLRVENDATSYRSFLKFTVAGTGTTVYRAKLRLFVTNGSPDGGSLYRVSNYFPGTSTPWTEETLTWANMPVMGGTALGNAGSVSPDDFVEFDVTAAIRGDGTYSFGLQSGSTNNVDYSSKEGEESPVLVIETLPGGGGTNLVPAAIDNAYSVAEDGTLTQAAPGVLVNDTDTNGDALTVILTTSPTHGTLTLAANGSFTYTPSPNYNGPDSFAYSADDLRGGLDPATVTLTVTPVNDAPVAVDEGFTTGEDVPLGVAAPGVRTNDTDVDGDALTVSVVSAPAHGSLVLNANGGFTYTPVLDWNGVDGFTYAVSDGKGGSDTGAATLTVTAVEDPPRATDDTYSTAEDQSLSVAAPGPIGNDSDPEGDALTASIAAPPAHGTLGLAANGSFTYTPQANYNGPDAFDYTLRDAKGGTDTGRVSLAVAAVNDAPQAVDDAAATNEDVPYTLAAPGLLANDSDLDGDALVASVAVPPSHGAVVLAPNGGYTYTPSADFVGMDAFDYTVNDGHGGTATATVILTIGAVNDAPDAVSDQYATPEDAGLQVPAPGILANDVDADGDALTVALLAAPAQGTLTLNANGSFAYVPPRDFNGVVTFTYTLRDGQGGSATGTATLTVTAVNDPPIAADDMYVLDEDVPLTLGSPGILGNDSDVDADTLTASIVVPPAHGTLTLNANGGLVYTPALDFVGSDAFTYRTSDPRDANDTAIVTFSVRAVNDLPAAASDSYLASEDLTLRVATPGPLGNDSDVDGDALFASVVSPPAHGTLTLEPDGGFTFTPVPDWNGTDTFTYGVSDTKGGTASGTVTIAVAAVNDPPVAADDAETTPEDVPLTRSAPGLLTNDIDVDGDALTAAIAVPPAHGTLALNANGSFTYTPAANYHGPDSFTYTVRDAQNVTDTGAVIVNVVAVNDAPVADTDGYVTNEDVPLAIPAPGLLGNDTDVDGDALTAVVGTAPAHGTLALDSDGSFVYTPARDWNGTDTFTYRARDPNGATDTESVVLYIAPRNDAPVAGNDTYATDEDKALTVGAPGLLTNDTDVERDALTVVLASPPTHGTAQVTTNGAFTYTPAPQYFGTDSFTYTLRDASGASTTGSVALTVRAVNDAPVGTDDAYTTDEDTPLVVAAPGVLGNDSDIENDVLTASVSTPPAHGTLALAPQGGFTYTPASQYFGADTFVYTLRDPSGATVTGTVLLTVRAVNDAPVIADDTFITDEDTPLVIAAPGLLANDTDVEADPLRTRLVAAPTRGTVTLGNDGSFTYQPASDAHGPDAFTYAVDDDHGGSATGTVALVVRPVNDAPVVANETYTFDEDTPLVVDAPGLLANDSDVDGDALEASPAQLPAHGTLVLDATGSCRYTPASDFYGTDRFTYTVDDGRGAARTASVDIVVRPVNDAPVGLDLSVATDEDTPLAVNAPGVLGLASDVDGDAMSAAVAVPPAHGTLTLAADGGFTYTPAPDFFGPDVFEFEVRDPSGATDRARVMLAVRPLQDAPAVTDDSHTLAEDDSLAVPAPGVLGNDTDVDGDVLTARLDTAPAHGVVVLSADGSFVYRPNPDAFGTDAFTYLADDGHGGVQTGVVTLTVTAVNDSPVAVDDTFATDEDVPLNIAAPGIVANDRDADGDVPTVRLADAPAHGTVRLQPDGSFVYEPAPDYNGSDTFTYDIDDGHGGVARGAVQIAIAPGPDAPVATSDTWSLEEDGAREVPAPGVLGNDTDVDGDALQVRLVTPPAHGTLDLDPSGGFRYAPEANWNGTDTFVYAADDGSGRTALAPVTLEVRAVNDTPAAAQDAYTLDEDVPLASDAPGVLANDSDVDAEAIQAVLLTAPAHGTLVLRSDGGLTYTPDLDFNGEDLFVYAARDAAGEMAAAVVRLDITPVNDAPRPGDDDFAVSEDDTLRVAGPGLLGNDMDVEGEALSAALSLAPSHGSVTVAPDGGFLYVPAPDFSGTDGFVYTVRDASGNPSAGSVALRVTPVNDAPRAAPDSFVVDAEVPATIVAPGILRNDVDVDADSLRAVVVEAPQYGALALEANGSFVYTPLPGFTGPDTFTYRVEDGRTADVSRVALIVQGRGVTYHESAAGMATGAAQVETQNALAAVSGDLYLAAISTQPFQPATSVTGMGIGWTRVRSQCGGHGDTGVELWMARGAPNSGTVAATFAATAEHAALVVSRYAGADPADPIGTMLGGNSAGIEAECSGGGEGSDYAWSMHTLTEGGILYRAIAARDRDHTATDGAFVRRQAVAGSAPGIAAVQVDDHAVDAGDHAVGGQFSAAVDWAAVAVEIRSARVDDTLRFSETLVALPNPFTGRTLVQFTLYRRAAVDIQIFDVRGRLVRRLLHETRPPGRLQIDWNATDARGQTLDSGVYFLRLQSDGHTVTRKVVLLK